MHEIVKSLFFLYKRKRTEIHRDSMMGSGNAVGLTVSRSD